ncbi:alpha/beta-hydrolase [Choiromyces venosus 120613-1]|uniref:Carboxylic ester hydrolase n=1 Tax=Choiromyces venosus 120613-1 TaxID=1336337 RepID=A0A3N4JE25_9PEZI|nr:alpha/beta-hydrolase [Choiromyces venosus 120613-1]
MTTISHATLNSRLTGISIFDDRVLQFRGLKFASVSKRFARAELFDKYPSELDCTRHGPICPQEPPDSQVDFFGIPANLQKGKFGPTFDELECLNLAVVVPKSHIANISSGRKLPVLVNIHGGANRRGAGCTPVQDLAGLGAASVTHGKEVICVALNYRLNVFGYGVLPNGEGSNNGLFDQQVGLVWVKKHIAGFGGDPENITLSGSSSGALSVDAQLHASSPVGKGLFKRAVMQSGCIDIGAPKSREKMVRTTQRVADSVEQSGGEKDEDWVEKLRNASVRQVIGGLVQAQVRKWCLTDDDTFFPSPWDQEAVGIPDWCESIITGDCGFESYVWYPQIAPASGTAIHKAFSGIEKHSSRILETYKVPAPSQESTPALRAAAFAFISDGVYSYPAHKLASRWRAAGKKVYEHCFDQANPYTPELRGAHHGVDLLYLFPNYELPEKDAVVAGEFQKHVLEFCRSGKAWEVKDGQVMGYGPAGKVGVVEKKDRRRVAEWEDSLELLGRVELVQAIESILKIQPEPTGAKF